MEEKSEFEGILQDYIGSYHPQHRDELDLLTEAVFAKWKQQRLWLAETSQIEVAMALHERDLQKVLPNANAGAHLANAIAKSEQILKLYLRYDAQYHRHYYNCLKRLKELQDGRVPLDAGPDPAPIEPKLEAEIPPAPQPAPPPNEPKLTPEQARLQFMKAEIKRFDDHQAALLGRQKAFADPAN